MRTNEIFLRDTRDLPTQAVVRLYSANEWSSANKPDLLIQALRNSHSVISAWVDDQLVGLGKALSDGFLVVYYPHLLVHPDCQGQGIGTEILSRLIAKYQGFHQHILVADGRSVEFYRKCGFTRAGETQSMWIYAGDDH